MRKGILKHLFGDVTHVSVLPPSMRTYKDIPKSTTVLPPSMGPYRTRKIVVREYLGPYRTITSTIYIPEPITSPVAYGPYMFLSLVLACVISCLLK